MKRDWDLVRQILLCLEDREGTQSHLEPTEIEDRIPEDVSYHIYIMEQAGLIEATCSKYANAPMYCIAVRLTWEGHEFLDAIRADTTWNKTKELIKEKGLGISMYAIKAAAAALVRSMFL